MQGASIIDLVKSPPSLNTFRGLPHAVRSAGSESNKPVELRLVILLRGVPKPCRKVAKGHLIVFEEALIGLVPIAILRQHLDD